MLCLTNESVNTATLVHAPVCVCVLCVQHTPHRGLRDASALEIPSGGGARIEFPPGPDPDRSPDFEKHWSTVPIPAIAQLSGSRLLRSSAAPHTEARAGSERRERFRYCLNGRIHIHKVVKIPILASILVTQSVMS